MYVVVRVYVCLYICVEIRDIANVCSSCRYVCSCVRTKLRDLVVVLSREMQVCV